MVSSTFRILRTNIHKALCEYSFLKNKSYPDFVYEKQCAELRNEIPVFCFHSVTTGDFEAKLAYLVENGYQTLTADELYEQIANGTRTTSKAVALTFDDGWRSLWTVAYPLLKKYGLVGVSFIVPRWVHTDNKDRSEQRNLNGKRSEIGESHHQKSASKPYITWREAREMHESGVIDFQSHSLTHATVFTSDRIVDFLNPLSTSIAHKIPPALHAGQMCGKYSELGAPLYTVAPLLTGARRYVDDARLREACVSFVKQQGGDDFFTKHAWRGRLEKFVTQYRAHNRLLHRYETDSERNEAIHHELLESRTIIEKRLGKSVRHVCYPFFSGSLQALELSRQCGYVTNFWGWQAPPNARHEYYGRQHLYEQVDMTDFSTGSILKGRRTNTPGDDPYRIVRLPADYIFRLPGKGRQSLSQIMMSKCFRNLTHLKR